MAEESYPEELRYHPEHDWARIEGETATFGITWYAQDALGEVVFYEPPETGKQVTKDQAYAEVESVKAVSDVYAPLSGEVTEVNSALSENPEKINQDPYGDGWMFQVNAPDAKTTLRNLLSGGMARAWMQDASARLLRMMPNAATATAQAVAITRPTAISEIERRS